jgi:hypothetical protein
MAVSVDRTVRADSPEQPDTVPATATLNRKSFKSFMLYIALGIEWTNETTKNAICCRRRLRRRSWRASTGAPVARCGVTYFCIAKPFIGHRASRAIGGDECRRLFFRIDAFAAHVRFRRPTGSLSRDPAVDRRPSWIHGIGPRLVHLPRTRNRYRRDRESDGGDTQDAEAHTGSIRKGMGGATLRPATRCRARADRPMPA